MPQVFFVHFLPDDYHGAPEPHVSTEEIHIPTKNEVYEAWSDAGYNAYHMCGEEGEEYSFFLEHGDSAIYYAAYLIITDEEMYPEDFERELSYDTEILQYIISDEEPGPGDPEELSDSIMKEMPGVVVVIPIYG